MAELTDKQLQEKLKAQKAELGRVQQERARLEKRAGQIAQIKQLKQQQSQEVKRAKELTPSRKRTLIRGLKATARTLGKAERQTIRGARFLVKEERAIASSPEAKGLAGIIAGRKSKRVR